MNKQTRTPSTSKVRRDMLGGKRGDGHARDHRIRRPDARKIRIGSTSHALTAVAGLAPFGSYLRALGVDAELRARFGRLKADPRVIYPMDAQMRMLIDANVVGETRIFGVEALAGDPLYARLCGGSVPSLDTLYRDLTRFDAAAIEALDAMLVDHGLEGHGLERHVEVHLDIDTTIEPLHGAHEGAVAGRNPQYHMRPSYHPIVTRLQETGTCVGALLRPGDRGFGIEDAAVVGKVVRRVRARLRPRQSLFVRMDAAGDCAPVMRAVAEAGAFFVFKARLTPDLRAAVTACDDWTTVDRDACGHVTTQAAEISFARGMWKELGLRLRVVAIRTNEMRAGRQIDLWNDDRTTRVYLTNCGDAPELVAARYDRRAGIEPLIAEWKNGWGIGQAPCFGFDPNHVALLLKLLGHNLVQRFVRCVDPTLASAKWHIAWLRRVVFCVPAMLVQTGRRWTVNVMPTARLARLRQ